MAAMIGRARSTCDDGMQQRTFERLPWSGVS